MYNSAPEVSKVEVSAGSHRRGLRFWIRIILLPSMTGLLLGFGLSFAFSPKYVSQSLVLVQNQNVPEDIAPRWITADLGERVAELEQVALAQSNLQPMLERLRLTKPDRNLDDLIDDIRANVSVEPVSASPMLSHGKDTRGLDSETPGFMVTYATSSPREAQEICAVVTDLILNENLKSRERSISETTAFLNREVDRLKQTMKTMDTQFLEQTKPRASSSPADEPGYRMLTLQLDIQKKAYADELSKLTQAQAVAIVEKDLEAENMGEQMQLQSPADLPDAPIFPSRLLFAGTGLGAGLALGLGRGLRLKFRRVSPLPTEVAAQQ